MLCTQVMNGISSALKALPFAPGTDFDVVLVSFDPRDTPADAAEKKRTHLQYWSTEATAGGWHFLTGDEADHPPGHLRPPASPTSGTSAQQQFAHVSGVLVVTPDGRLSRYFYGIEYSPKELRLALVDSGEGRVGSVIDELLLYCFHYDPEAGRVRRGRHEPDPSRWRGHAGRDGRLRPADAASRIPHARGGSRRRHYVVWHSPLSRRRRPRSPRTWTSCTS